MGLTLLGRLTAAVDDEKIFDLSGIEDADAFRRECRAIMRDLYETAASNWAKMRGSMQAWVPKYPGAAVVEHYGPLHSCWIEDFTAVIINLADAPDLPGPNGGEQDGREFLYFMLGVLWCGWQEHIRRLHEANRTDNRHVTSSEK